MRPERRRMQSAMKWVLFAILAAPLWAQQQLPDFDSVRIQVLPVQKNIYMISGAGGNITLQTGKDGVLMVDTEFAPLAPRIMAEIRKLSNGPLRYIINTHMHRDHTGGNEAFAKMVPADPAQP